MQLKSSSTHLDILPQDGWPKHHLMRQQWHVSQKERVYPLANSDNLHARARRADNAQPNDSYLKVYEASDIQGRLSRSSSQAPARAKALERALRMVY